MDKADFIVWARKLQESYRASEAVRQQLSKVDLVAIVGPTGVGKTTIINKLQIPLVKSDVTRAMRPDEKDNLNYRFRNDYADILQEIKRGEFAQFLVSESGDFYGTHTDAYPSGGRCAMAVVAKAMPDFQAMGFRSITPIYIMPPGYVEWMRRVGELRAGDLSARIAESVDSIRRAIQNPAYKFVLNDNIDLAVADVEAILEHKDLDEHRKRLARETADVLLERLGDQDDSIYFGPEVSPTL
jgi:guanylate kinase